MTTMARIDANRQNSRLSTGPTSPAGKARAARNAIRDGFYAKVENLPAREQQDLTTVYAELRERCAPDGPLEDLAIERIAMNTWRLRQLLVVEAGVYARYEEIAAVSPPTTLRHPPPATGSSDYTAPADAVIRDAAGANALEKSARRRVGVERALDRDQRLLLELQRARKDAARALIDTDQVGEAVGDERMASTDAAQPTHEGDTPAASTGVGDMAPDAGTDGEDNVEDGASRDYDGGIGVVTQVGDTSTPRSG